jgi:amidase
MQRSYLGAYYVKAQKLLATLCAGYDRALSEFEVVVMPTTPSRPHEYARGISVSEKVKRGWAVLANTSATDMTGHPALAIPLCRGRWTTRRRDADRAPFDDARLPQLARTFERQFGWVPHHPGDPRTPQHATA